MGNYGFVIHGLASFTDDDEDDEDSIFNFAAPVKSILERYKKNVESYFGVGTPNTARSHKGETSIVSESQNGTPQMRPGEATFD